MELKKIGVLSLAKIAGLFGVIYGLISGILVTILYAQAVKVPEIASQLGVINQLGYSSIIVLPLLYGILYFLAGIVTAFIYNLLAKYVGGIELEFKEKKKK